jgi:hypothetical protein
MRKAILLAIALSAAGRAEVVDRVVASVGKQVVTLSDVQREQRMVCYLNEGDALVTAPERIRELAGKLVDRILIRQEMEGGAFVEGPQEELDGVVLGSELRFPSVAAREAALARCRVTQTEVFAYLALQSRILDFIDFRVLPGMQIDSAEIQNYYDKEFVPASQKRGQAAPPLDQVRDKIAALLKERQVNERLDAWLKELRTQAEIRIR